MVGAQQLSLAKPGAPTPKSDAPQLSREQVSPRQERGRFLLREGVQKPNEQPPIDFNLPPSMDGLVELYARLTGQKAVSSLQYGQERVSFEVATPLTKEEALYAIDATLRLNGLEIVPAGEKSIQLGPFWERSKAERKTPTAPEAK